MARKTISIELIKEKANSMLLHSQDEKTEARSAIHSFVNMLLHDVNAYKGFGYLSARQMEESRNGKSIGVLERDHRNPNKDLFAGTDQTRIFFY